MSEKQGIVFDIKEFAVFDGPGIRTTVFMKGCPLRCQWCHNPEGLSPKPQLMVSTAACTNCGACQAVCPSPEKCTACGKCVSACRGGFRKIVGTPWEAEVLAARLRKDQDVFLHSGGGVTFSGGEPLMQWDFVKAVIERMPGIHTAIETSGFVSDAVFQSAMDTCDLIMLDWKVSDQVKHKHYTGVDQEPIRRHAEMLARGNTPFILRMPMIPGVNDEPEHFETAARLVADSPMLQRIELLPYQPAAGAKYGMVGMQYQAPCDDLAKPTLFTEIFKNFGIPWKEFH